MTKYTFTHAIFHNPNARSNETLPASLDNAVKSPFWRICGYVFAVIAIALASLPLFGLWMVPMGLAMSFAFFSALSLAVSLQTSYKECAVMNVLLIAVSLLSMTAITH